MTISVDAIKNHYNFSGDSTAGRCYRFQYSHSGIWAARTGVRKMHEHVFFLKQECPDNGDSF